MKTVPKHLQRYVVKQDYSRYSPEDHAVWRYTMRQLKSFLSEHAHEAYIEGLERTGISTDTIPRIENINDKLMQFGWGAVPVSGFIPPAAFMEFQALGFLPIASDMRSVDHVLYTPAPDIVHEAAGHAPILVDPKFAQYLKSYAEVASKAIISSEDLQLYEAIRVLSDIKEDPDSSAELVAEKEKALVETVESMSFVSEASLLGRMNWWTAEYGLIGDIENPKIFGAGLLSSIGESQECLSDKVKKIPLSVDCVDYSYDITEPQPQLFVTPNFETLIAVLEDLASRMAFRKGGLFGLRTALTAQTINTVQLESGLQISGQLTEVINDGNDIQFLKFEGPSQLSFANQQMQGHSTEYHAHGYSTPLGDFECSKALQDWAINSELQLKYSSGIELTGSLKSLTEIEGQNVLATFTNCSMKLGDRVLFEPEWGDFDLAFGKTVASVFGGPADRAQFGEFETFVAKRVPQRQLSPRQIEINDFYQLIDDARSDQGGQDQSARIEDMIATYREKIQDQWLIGVQLLELCYQFKVSESVKSSLIEHLHSLKNGEAWKNKCIDDGIRLAEAHL